MQQATRRQLLLGLAGAAALPVPARAQAPDGSAQYRRYAAISLIGDELVLVYPTAQVGSALDRNYRRTLPDSEGSFDAFALRETGRAVEAGGAPCTLLQVAPGSLHRQPEALVNGQEIALPDALVDPIEAARATHVLLLTKAQGSARIALREGGVGIGMLRGLGYYIDRSTRLRVMGNGHTGVGFIAPYVYAQLTLADARNGQVLRTRALHATHAYSVARSAQASDPWDVLDAAEKVQRLRELLQGELARAVPELLRA